MAQPLLAGQVLSLADMGINASSFKFGVLTMESDRFICAKDTNPDGSPVVITIDMHNGNQVTKKPMKAEAALMNPTDNILALRAKQDQGVTLQVFNLDTKEKLGVYSFSETVVFWRWINNRTLGIVTDKSVYHWNLEAANGPEPQKIFDRFGKLAEASTQIINYTVNAAQTWCLLTGISTPDGGKTIDGSMQLWSVERKLQQLLEGHAGTFGEIVVDDNIAKPTPVLAFMERKSGSTQTKLHITDLSKSTQYKVQMPVEMPAESAADFAVAMEVSEKHGMVYVATKGGLGMAFETVQGNRVFCNRVSPDAVFIGCGSKKQGGMLIVNRKGILLSFSVNEQTLVNYVMNNMPQVANSRNIAFTLARRFGYPGAGDMFKDEFARFFQAGDYANAARIAAQDKSGTIRNADTIAMFKSVPHTVGAGASPLLQYFSKLLEFGKLNAEESEELVRPVVQQNRREFIEKWLREDKLTCTKALGDMIKPLDTQLAQSVYVRAASHQDVIVCLVEQNQVERIVEYVKRVNYTADYNVILRNMLAVNPEGAVKFAKDLLANEPPLLDVQQAVDVFMSMNKLQETTSILLDALKGNKPEHAALQTKLYEMNLMQNPQTAEAIFQMNQFTHYDKPYIAQLCEKAGLYQRALEHYTEASDIKRCMLHSHTMSNDFLVGFMGKLGADVALELMQDMMRYNRQQNLNTVVQVAKSFHDQIGTMRIVEMFTSFSSWEGVFFFLGGILSSSNDPEVHFKYIEAASHLGHMQEVERVCKESTVYDPLKVKEFLKEMKLPDPRPLIYVCDLHGYVEELAEYLYKNSLMKYIEVYVTKVNPQNTPQIVGTLIDLDCSEDFIKTLLQNVRAQCPAQPLVEEMEKRNRLRLLLPWLEARVSEGNQESALHSALAKIYVDLNRDPETFLKNNAFYDSGIVGKYCEDRDPNLAYIAYKRAWGTCDEQLIAVTNKNGLFRLQARYLVERQSPELWSSVLSDGENEYRRSVIDQVISTALPESKNPDEVSAAVKAFIAADYLTELIELLEKIVLHNSDFSTNGNLQNLLLLTAIKADKSRVMDYVNRLNHYDAAEIAKIALGDPHNLTEEAFTIYKKHNMDLEAIDTLLTNMNSIDRAADFATRVNKPEVWYKLGKAQLLANRVTEAMQSYLKACDPRDYVEVITSAEREEYFSELVVYLRMARSKVKDSFIDSELVYSLAKAEIMSDLEEFLKGSTTANLQAIGDRLFDEGLYRVAKMLFATIPNNSKLASCHVNLGDFPAAIEAAKKANNPKTWKDVNMACVTAKEFAFARTAGMNIIVHPDHLEELISHYEGLNYVDELIKLLEGGLTLENAHAGLFTELGILYAKHRPEKLMDYVKAQSKGSSNRLNVSKLTRVCERYELWAEAVFLYVSYDEFDSAAMVIMGHSDAEGCYSHEDFVPILQKVSNTELYYRAINFYLDVNPTKLSTLLETVLQKLDHVRVVGQLRKVGKLPLLLDYLAAVQSAGNNISAVNEAINELYLARKEYDSLKSSIQKYDNFDQLALAESLEKSEELELRRIAATIYSQNKKFGRSIELSKKDNVFADAMDAAVQSGSVETAEGLLKYFAVEAKDKENFSLCLKKCFSLVRPDFVLELSWKESMIEEAMPFMVLTLRNMNNKIDRLAKIVEKNDEEKQKEKSAPNDLHDFGGPGLGGHLALTAHPNSFPGPSQQQQQHSMNGAFGMQPSPHLMGMGPVNTPPNPSGTPWGGM